MTNRRLAMLFLGLCALPFAAARADIGAVGGAGIPADAPVPAVAGAPVEPPEAPAPTPAGERKPLLVIRFNQHRVYFEHALQQAIQSTEQLRAGSSYDVISYMPSGKNRQYNERMSNEATDNLQNVVTQMQTMGIPVERIHASTQSGVIVPSQEVRIYIN